MNLQVVDKSLITEDIINERAPIAAMQTTAARSAESAQYTEQLPQIKQAYPRLLGYARLLYASIGCAKGAGWLSQCPLYFAQPLRSLGAGRAPRDVQRLHRLYAKRLNDFPFALG